MDFISCDRSELPAGASTIRQTTRRIGGLDRISWVLEHEKPAAADHHDNRRRQEHAVALNRVFASNLSGLVTAPQSRGLPQVTVERDPLGQESRGLGLSSLIGLRYSY